MKVDHVTKLSGIGALVLFFLLGACSPEDLLNSDKDASGKKAGGEVCESENYWDSDTECVYDEPGTEPDPDGSTPEDDDYTEEDEDEVYTPGDDDDTGPNQSPHQNKDVPYFKVKTVQLSGDACPYEGATVQVAEDLSTIKILYGELNAVSVGGKIEEDVKECYVKITAKYADLQLAVKSTRLIGHADLGEKTEGSAYARYTIEQDLFSYDADVSETWTGPASADPFKLETSEDELQFAPCGGEIKMVFHTKIATKATVLGAEGKISLDKNDGDYRNQINFKVNECYPSQPAN